MVDEIITRQELIDAQKDAQSLDDFINGDDEQIVVTRLLKEYPTLANAIRQIYEKGGKFYPTLADANADIANIRTDVYVITGDNGAYYKATAGATTLTKSAYDPLTQAKDYVQNTGFARIETRAQEVNINYTTSDRNLLIQGTVRIVSNTDKYTLATPQNISLPLDTPYRLEYVIETGLIQAVSWDANRTNGSLVLGFVVASSTSFRTNDFEYSIDGIAVIYASKNDINELKSVVNKPIFPIGSPILSTAYIAQDAIELVEFWGLEDGESVYLRTLWNYYFLSDQNKYFSSIGFNSSKNQHIAIGLAPQSKISLYSMFEVTEKLNSTIEYLLYRNGDASTEPVGRVRVNWSKVNNSTTQRFIKTDNSNPLIVSNVVNKASQQVLQIAKSITPESPFFGKKIGAIGDSITWGFTPRNDPNGGITGAQLDSWLVLSAQKLGMTAFNYGISGSTLGANSSGANSPFSRRYQNMADNLDVICVMGGTNDVRKGVPIGAMTDRVDTTFYGALHVICQGLIDKYYINQGTELGKSKQIVLMTPIKLQVSGGTALDTSIEPYVQAVKDVGAYYSIPVLDMYNLSGITPHISQTVQGTEAGYTQTYNVYITDGTHPTQQGHEKMANVFSGFLKTLK